VYSVALAVLSLGLQSRISSQIGSIVYLVYPYLLVPLFANSFYHRFIRRRIDAICARISDPALRLTELSNFSATNSMGWIVAIPVGVSLIGVIAAIAIPAYQTYVIRAQVTEGLNLARPLQEAVTRAYAQTHQWVADDRDLGTTFTLSGHFVSQVVIIDGSVIILYGNAAGRIIVGKELVLKPRVDGRGVAWECGYRIEGGSVTSVPPRVLPSRCRG
jgi:type IV pilus assembly protein PilA